MPRRRFRRTRFKLNGSALKTAKIALKKVNVLTRGVEMKYFDGVQDLTIGTGGSIVHLTGVAQNDLVDGRTGNKITVKSILIRWSVDNSPNALSTSFRWILFQDRQQITDTAPTLANLLQIVDVLSPQNRPRLGRFRIIRDILVDTSSVGRTIRSFKFFIKMDTNVRYNGPLASDMQKNNLFVGIISDENVNPPTYRHNVRLGYTDL